MKKLFPSVFMMVIMVALLWLVWQWGFCRFYVEPGYMAVVTAKTGQPLDPGQILARPEQKGVREDVLGEGRHFLNPVLYDVEIVPIVNIPVGKIGIATSKIGTELPEGEFLADAGQKGIRRHVLGPGKYRLNPYGYVIDIINAVSIPVGYVGVLTSLSGKQPDVGEFAGAGEKGVRADVLQPGLYYVNSREYKVDVLEVGVNQVSLLGAGGQVITKRQIVTKSRATDELQRTTLMGQQEQRRVYLEKSESLAVPEQKMMRVARIANIMDTDGAMKGVTFGENEAQPVIDDDMATFALNQMVEFPSRDGFDISLDMTVEFELLPEALAEIYRNYGDLPAVVEKIILPQILSVSRLKGSAYGAKDFVVGEGREKFQKDLTETLAGTLKEKRIVVHNALIRHVGVPMQILDPIQQASIAAEQDLTNREMQNTARKLAELNTEQALIEQRRAQVAQETEKLKAEIKADQDKQVALTLAEATRRTAEIAQQTAGVRAERKLKIGQAEAEVIKLVDGEKAKGQIMKVQAFGDARAYSLAEFASGLNDWIRINIIHAGDGTLWTDLENARLGDLGGAEVLSTRRPAVEHSAAPAPRSAPTPKSK